MKDINHILGHCKILIFISLSFFSLQGFAQDDYSEIRGKVVDSETGEPIAFAKIYFESNNGVIGVQSDFEGRFKLYFPLKYVKGLDEIEFSVSFFDYSTYTLIIQTEKLKPNQISILEDIKLSMPDIDVWIPETPQSLIDFDKNPDAMRSTTIKVNELKHKPGLR